MEICLDLIANFMIVENLAERIEKKVSARSFSRPLWLGLSKQSESGRISSKSRVLLQEKSCDRPQKVQKNWEIPP